MELIANHFEDLVHTNVNYGYASSIRSIITIN